MMLTGFDVFRYRLPLAAPLRLRGAPFRERQGLLLRLENDAGAVGWGEASPLPGFSRESLAQAEEHLLASKAVLVGRTTAGSPIDPDGAFVCGLEAQGLVASVRFGLQLAAWSLYADARGKTLPEVVSPQPRAVLSVNGLLTGTEAEVLRDARRMREAGYRAVKLKVGRRPVAEEAALVQSLAAVLGADVGLRLDANRAWSLKEAGSFVRGLAGCRIEYLEEPLADPSQLPAFGAGCGVPIALDESLVGMDAEALAHHAYARAVVLKPTLLGGFAPALRLARCAASLGMTPVISAAYETGLGIRGLVALAAGLGDADVPVGLDTYRRLAEDIIAPRLEMEAGTIDVAAMMKVERTLRRAFLHRL